jgi:hypothetical protein
MNRLLTLALIWLTAATATATEIVVEPGGSLHEALRQAREWRRTDDARANGGITIIVRGGRHYMSEPLFLRPEDSGTAESPLVIRGEQGAVICGDPRQQHTQLFPAEGMARILDFNTETRTITIPNLPEGWRSNSPLLEGRGRGEVSDNTPLEMLVHQRWAIAILRVKDVSVHDGFSVVSFMEPESRLEFEHPWPQPVISQEEEGNSSFLLRTTEQRMGVEQLVVVDGASYVTFEGLTFENTCWNRPQLRGHVTLQGGFALVDAYKLANPGLPWDKDLENQAWVERPVSAVSVSNAAHVDVRSCTFRHLGATALDYVCDVSDCTISGNTFSDIGGTAIMAGSFAESPREVHRPYRDLAARCQRIIISDNRISDAACEDWGAVAIGCGYVRDVVISGNDISRVNYSGICVGWGWTAEDTGMRNNLIYKNNVRAYARQLYDTGGIYTLSNQPQSAIRDNVIAQPDVAPYATNDRAFCIYLDAHSDGFTISGNTTEGRPIRRDEIGDNQPGPHIIFK